MELNAILNSLEEEQRKINQCTDEDELDPIASAIISILQRCNYKNDSAHISSLNQFYKRNKIDAPGFADPSLPISKKNLSKLIQNVITDINVFGIPEPTKENNTISPLVYNYNNNSQSQQQQQSTSVDIVIEALRSELSDEQIDELKALCKKGESKGNILKKIAGWGVNTASIVGNILTSPKFWELLDKIPH